MGGRLEVDGRWMGGRWEVDGRWMGGSGREVGLKVGWFGDGLIWSGLI